MRDYIDENDKKNEIRLLFKHPLYKNKVIVVVEGKSDVRLFRSIIESERIKIETIDGKKDLVSIMKVLSVEFPHQILAICDADHDHLLEASNERKEYSVYVTDYHDAEVMMLNSLSLKSFIQEYSSFNNIEYLQSELMNSVLVSSYSIGILRWINTAEELNINFKGLNFNKFISVNKINVTVDIKTLIDELLTRSPSKPSYVTNEFLNGKIEEYNSKQGCDLQVCCGHDITNIISIIYRQKWASLETNMDSKKVESALRVGYQREFFKNTELYENILNFLEIVDIELKMC